MTNNLHFLLFIHLPSFPSQLLYHIIPQICKCPYSIVESSSVRYLPMYCTYGIPPTQSPSQLPLTTYQFAYCDVLWRVRVRDSIAPTHNVLVMDIQSPLVRRWHSPQFCTESSFSWSPHLLRYYRYLHYNSWTKLYFFLLSPFLWLTLLLLSLSIIPFMKLYSVIGCQNAFCERIDHDIHSSQQCFSRNSRLYFVSHLYQWDQSTLQSGLPTFCCFLISSILTTTPESESSSTYHKSNTWATLWGFP